MRLRSTAFGAIVARFGWGKRHIIGFWITVVTAYITPLDLWCILPARSPPTSTDTSPRPHIARAYKYEPYP